MQGSPLRQSRAPQFTFVHISPSKIHAIEDDDEEEDEDDYMSNDDGVIEVDQPVRRELVFVGSSVQEKRQQVQNNHTAASSEDVKALR